MKHIPNNSIQLTVTSPPYGSIRNYNNIVDIDELFKQLLRITKDGGVVVWITHDTSINGSETGQPLSQALTALKIGFKLHDTMIYLKNYITYPSVNRYHDAFEFMFVLSKNSPSTFNPIKDKPNVQAGKKISGTERRYDNSTRPKPCNNNTIPEFSSRLNWWIPKPDPKGIQNQHPATFPYQLAHDHILSWSNPSDTILDPMCGSGTTILAAINTNRNYIGIDISPEYISLTKKRINNPSKQGWLSL
jgi:site-specific DNA-methyltransferase (adenine-specific)